MWWIFAIIVPLFIILIIVLVVLGVRSYNKGDYKDGGGNFVGGNNDISFFAPQNERKGVWGENIANYHLRPLLRNDEYILGNLIFTFKAGGYSEIDSVIISRKGVFCIETKYWVGHISGSDSDKEWIQEYDDPRLDDRHHPNPVMQNNRHCMLLKSKLKNKYYIQNVVIFVRLEDGRGIDSDYAFTISEFKEFYRDLDGNILTEEEVQKIYNILKPYIATEEQLKHYKKIRNN